MFNQALSVEQQAALDWLDEVCGAAFKEARGGSLALINRLGKHDSLSFYINNVVGTKTVTREQFARQYPGLLTEAMQLHGDYLDKIQMKEAVTKTNDLETRLAELKTLVEAQAEQLKTLAEAKPADKKKPAKPVEADDAESEA